MQGSLHDVGAYLQSRYRMQGCQYFWQVKKKKNPKRLRKKKKKYHWKDFFTLGLSSKIQEYILWLNRKCWHPCRMYSMTYKMVTTWVWNNAACGFDPGAIRGHQGRVNAFILAKKILLGSRYNQYIQSDRPDVNLVLTMRGTQVPGEITQVLNSNALSLKSTM